jgi:hypothetical protein
MRPRIGLTSENLLEDERLHVLGQQLSSLEDHFQVELNPIRHSSALEVKSLRKLMSNLMFFLGYVLNTYPTVSSPRLEHCLNALFILNFIKYLFGSRGATFTTVRDYLTSFLQLLDALSSLGLPHCRGDKARALVSSLRALRKQICQKGRQVGSHTRMARALETREVLESGSYDALSNLCGPLRFGLLIEYAASLAESWLAVYECVPIHVWHSCMGRQETLRHYNLFVLSRQLLVCWWRVVQGGVDLPPLRSSMILSLCLPHKVTCSHSTCSIPGCSGNQVVLSPPGKVVFKIVHHKSSKHQGAFMGGPICPSPPAHSLTTRLTLALANSVLPYLYSLMGDTGPVVMPVLPDVWTGVQADSQLSYRPMSDTQYSKLWKEALGVHSCKPASEGSSSAGDDVLSSLELTPCAFGPNPFAPSDCRRQFVTAMVEKEAEMSADIPVVVQQHLRGVVARQVRERQ